MFDLFRFDELVGCSSLVVRNHSLSPCWLICRWTEVNWFIPFSQRFSCWQMTFESFLTDPGRKSLRTSSSTVVLEVVEVNARFWELSNTLERAETLFIEFRKRLLKHFALFWFFHFPFDLMLYPMYPSARISIIYLYFGHFQIFFESRQVFLNLASRWVIFLKLFSTTYFYVNNSRYVVV